MDGGLDAGQEGLAHMELSARSGGVGRKASGAVTAQGWHQAGAGPSSQNGSFPQGLETQQSNKILSAQLDG